MTVGILSMSLYGVVDAFWVGRLGSAQLSALGFVFPVILVLNNVAMGLGIGTASVLARALGAGDEERSRRLVSHGLGLAAVLAAFLGGLGLLSQTAMFSLLGADEGTLVFVREYMSVWYLGLPLLLLPRVANNALRATGDTVTPMRVMILGAGLNALIDPLLIFGWGIVPRLEVAGAAWATLIARSLALTISLWVLGRRDDLLEWPRAAGVELMASWRAILQVAVPATVSKLSFPVSMFFITGMVAVHGASAVAALGMCARIETLLMAVVAGLSASLLPFVGQNWGAGRSDRVRRGIDVSSGFVLLWGAALFLVFLLAAPAVAAAFSTDPQVIAVAALYLRILSPSWGFQGVSAVMSSAFNATGRPLYATAITLTRMFVLYLPLAWLGGSFWGLPGIFAGGCIASLSTGVGAMFWGRSLFTAPVDTATPKDVPQGVSS